MPAVVKLRAKTAAGISAIVLLAAAGVPPAWAHPEMVPTLVNRYLTMSPSGADSATSPAQRVGGCLQPPGEGSVLRAIGSGKRAPSPSSITG